MHIHSCFSVAVQEFKFLKDKLYSFSLGFFTILLYY